MVHFPIHILFTALIPFLYYASLLVLSWRLLRCTPALYTHISTQIIRLFRKARTLFSRSSGVPVTSNSTPLLTLNDDILPLIFTHLHRTDLVRCCRVNRIFLELAGKELYGDRNGVLVGKERYYHWAATSSATAKHVLVPSAKRSLFAGIEEPGEYDLYDLNVCSENNAIRPPPWPFSYFSYFNRRPFVPSPLKTHLIRNITHLVYATDSLREYDDIDSTSLFPSLRTLTIQHVDHEPQWDRPFLSGLRPKHIRLIHNSAMSGVEPNLNTGVGTQAEKLTYHLCEGDEWAKLEASHSEWPPCLKQLDIVFMTPIADNRSGAERDVPLPSYADVRPPLFSRAQLDGIVTSVAGMIVSAAISSEPEAKVRIIGLGRNADSKERWRMEAEFAAVGGLRAKFPNALKLQDRLFHLLLRKEYAVFSGQLGLGKEQAARSWRALDFITLEEYMAEEDYLPF